MALVTRYYIDGLQAAGRGLDEMAGRWRRFSQSSRKEIDDLEKAHKRSAERMDQKSNWLAGKMKAAYAAVAAFLTGKLVGALTRVTRALFEMATNVEETESKFETTFGAATEQVAAYIEENRKMLALTRAAAQEMTATAGAIVQGMGASKEAAAGFSTEIVALAGDLQSFHNVPVEETFRAIRSGLTGEMEPLKRFGIVLREDETKMRALVEAQKRGIDASSQQAIAYARLALITEKAGVAVGDLARTQGSTQNTLRSLRAEIAQFYEDFSRRLLPAFRDAIEYGRLLVRVYTGQAEVLSGRLADAVITGTQLFVDYVEQIRQIINAVNDLARTVGGADLTSGFEQLGRELRTIRNLVDMVSIGIYTIHAAHARLQQLAALGRGQGGLAAFWEQQALGSGQRIRDISQRRAADEHVQRSHERAREALAAAARLSEELDALEQRFADHHSGKARLSPADLSDLRYEVEALKTEWRGVIESGDTAAEVADAYAAALQRLHAVHRPPAPTDGGGGGQPPGADDEAEKRSLGIRHLREMADAYGPYREKLEEVHKAERDLFEMRKMRRGADGEEAAALDALIAQQERIIEANRREADTLRQTGYVLQGLERMQVRALADPRTAITVTRVTEATRLYAEQLARLKNEREAGLVSEEQYLRSAGRMSDEYQAKIRKLYEQMVLLGLYSPELEEAFRQAFDAGADGAEDVKNRARSLGSELRSVASALRSISTLGRIFGGMSREMDALISGTADVLDNMQQLAEVRERLREKKVGLGSFEGLLAQSVNVVGIATGALSILGGIVQSHAAQREALRRLESQLRENARAIRENTKALFRGGDVAPTVAPDVLEAARKLASALAGAATGTHGERMNYLAIFSELADLGIPGLDQYKNLGDTLYELIKRDDRLKGIFNSGRALSPEQIMEMVKSLLFGDGTYRGFDLEDYFRNELGAGYENVFEYLNRIAEGLGNTTKDLDGALKAVQRFTRYMGADAQQAFDFLLERLLTDTEGISSALRAQLEQLRGLDLSKESDRERLLAIIAAIEAARPDLLGGLSTDDLDKLLDALLGYADGRGLGGDGSAQSATFSRSITEVQANEIARYLEGIYVTLLRIADVLGAALAPVVSASSLSGGVTSLLPRSLSLPVSVDARRPVRFGDVHIDVRGGSAREVADEAAAQLREMIYDEMRQLQKTHHPYAR